MIIPNTQRTSRNPDLSRGSNQRKIDNYSANMSTLAAAMQKVAAKSK